LRRPARPLRALAPFVAAGLLALAASSTTGLEPRDPIAIPDSAFERVSVALPGPEASATPERTPDLRALRDPWLATPAPPSERARPSVPVAKPIVRPVPTPPPSPAGDATAGGGSNASTKHSISGFASWYCRAGISPCTYGHPDGSGFDAFAAAGPALREAIGPDWRGRVIKVDGIKVKLIDWCQCYQGEPNEKLLDLYNDVYKRTGTNVHIRW